MRVLVVEDEQKINRSVCQALREEAYAVDAAHDGDQGEELALINEYDLIILDLMLPKKSGIALCRGLRERGIGTPILMLTAKDSLEDRVIGLDSGADDYLVKPFFMDELLARARALLRRDTTVKSTRLQLADLVVDTSSHRVTRAGTPIDLTSKEYAMLEYFIRQPRQPHRRVYPPATQEDRRRLPATPAAYDPRQRLPARHPAGRCHYKLKQEELDSLLNIARMSIRGPRQKGVPRYGEVTTCSGCAFMDGASTGISREDASPERK
jgi:DNA-binding response OmpR family regulator